MRLPIPCALVLAACAASSDSPPGTTGGGADGVVDTAAPVDAGMADASDTATPGPGDAAVGDAAVGDAAVGDAVTDPLLSQLSNSDGCFVECGGPPPGPECVVWCEQVEAAPPWEWDPLRCEKPHYISDSADFPDSPTGDPECWAPPESWCAYGGGGAVTPACAPDGSACCSFGSTCIPCGWVNCMEAGAPDFCAPLVGQDADPFAFAPCPTGLPQQMSCILCGTALVCPLPKPLPRGNPPECPLDSPFGLAGGACDFPETVSCLYPALGCPAGAKAANTCRCEGGFFKCERPFHHCVPIPSAAAPDDPLRAAPPHRPEAPTCPEPPAPSACAASYADANHPSTCETTADCAGDSICLDQALGPDSTSCGCHPVGCRADADCPGGQACVCGTLTPASFCGGLGAPPCGHTCFEADCLTDADCGPARYCVPDGTCTGALQQGPLRCVDAVTDACFSDLECTGDERCRGVGKSRVCEEPPICD
ncbi:MAG: hypothetical protein AMXMBFR64_41510 [Myxococcales bacterium]